MPELPEVEIVKRSLLKLTNKANIIGIKIYNKNLRYKIPYNFINKLKGQKILRISRRAKYLIFYFKQKILLIHLGMSGKLLLVNRKNKKILKTSFYYGINILPKHNHLYFILSNGFTLIYNDVRRFGFLKLYDHVNLKKISFLKKLGFEPFSKKFNSTYFKKKINSKKKNIKNLLMDQNFVSGLGNIYVNEALFMSKIHPSRPCRNLGNLEIVNLISNIKKILKNSISEGGSSIKDFMSSGGKSGNFQQFFKVYARAGKKCSRISCKGEIKKIFISNRSSFYCDKCQK